MSMRALYVHFPFCETKCHYCDFYSLASTRVSKPDHSAFLKALHTEASLRKEELAPQLDTLFFGGGTPSMTTPKAMREALAPLELERRLHEKTEWTMEANPSSVSKESLKAYRELGVNRISMGVQSLNPHTLQKMGRAHSPEEALQALDWIFEAGFTRVSVDLLCGVPNQSQEDLAREIEILTSYPIDHLSCYLLTLTPKHFLFQDLPNEEEQHAHLLLVDRLLQEKGFLHYEISNFAKPGSEARHNLNYWLQGSVMGLGPSAHGLDAEKKVRHRNVNSLQRYTRALLEQNQLPIESSELLSSEQWNLERLMLRLRLQEGVSLNSVELPIRIEKIKPLLELQYLEHSPNENTLRLTPKGLPLLDSILQSLI